MIWKGQLILILMFSMINHYLFSPFMSVVGFAGFASLNCQTLNLGCWKLSHHTGQDTHCFDFHTEICWSKQTLQCFCPWCWNKTSTTSRSPACQLVSLDTVFHVWKSGSMASWLEFLALPIYKMCSVGNLSGNRLWRPSLFQTSHYNVHQSRRGAMAHKWIHMRDVLGGK